MPLQRPPYVSVGPDGRGVVYGQTLWIDIRASGTRSDGTKWVGTPLADASGFVSNVGRSIYQLTTVGGSVSLMTDLTTNNGGGSTTVQSPTATAMQQAVTNVGQVDLPTGVPAQYCAGIDPTTGLIAVESCPVIRTRTFVLGTEPKKYCGPEYHQRPLASPQPSRRGLTVP